jgi:hypothetical protein
MPSGGTKLTYIMKVAIRNLHVEYGHCTVKQTHENVLSNVEKVINGLRVSLAIPYIANRIMEEIGLLMGEYQ